MAVLNRIISPNQIPPNLLSRDQIRILLRSLSSEGGNPYAKVLPRSSFSFSFKSTVTEDPDFTNRNAVDFTYFSVPLVCCTDLDFQNFDLSEEEEIPRALKILVDQEEERRVKPCTDEIIAINVSTKEDPRLVQIGSTLSSEERERLIALLKDCKDIFTWSYEDMLGIDPEIVQHRIPLDPETRPVK